MWPAARVMLCAVDQCGVWDRECMLPGLPRALLRCNLQLIYIAWCPLALATSPPESTHNIYSWLYSPPKSRLTSTWKGSIFTFPFALSLLCGQPWSMAPSTVFSFVFFAQQKTVFQLQLIWNLALLPLRYTTRLTVNPRSSTRMFCWLNMVHMLGYSIHKFFFHIADICLINWIYFCLCYNKDKQIR
jgi:hypothetical protein